MDQNNFVQEGIEYNTTRTPLKNAEYGRNIQKMIDYIKTIDDREQRTKLAYAVVNIMGQLIPVQKERTDFRHTLWDQFHIIGNFEIDIDSPYPKPSPDILQKKPLQLVYPNKKIMFMHYGKIFQNMIEKVADMEEGEEKAYLTKSIANGMKKSYLNWNRESVTDDVIAAHLELISNGRLKLNPNEVLSSTQEILAMNKKKTSTIGSSNNNNNNNKKNKNNFQKNGFKHKFFHKKNNNNNINK